MVEFTGHTIGVAVPQIAQVAECINAIIDTQIIPEKAPEKKVMAKISEVFSELQQSSERATQSVKCSVGRLGYQKYHDFATYWNFHFESLFKFGWDYHKTIEAACAAEVSTPNLRLLVESFNNPDNFAEMCLGTNRYTQETLEKIKYAIATDARITLFAMLTCQHINFKNSDILYKKDVETLNKFLQKLDDLQNENAMSGVELLLKEFLKKPMTAALSPRKAASDFVELLKPSYFNDRAAYSVSFYPKKNIHFLSNYSDVQPENKKNSIFIDNNPTFTIRVFKADLKNTATVNHHNWFNTRRLEIYSRVTSFVNTIYRREVDLKEIGTDLMSRQGNIVFVSAATIATDSQLFGVLTDPRAGHTITKSSTVRSKTVKFLTTTLTVILCSQSVYKVPHNKVLIL